jgi:hypothetical protein
MGALAVANLLPFLRGDEVAVVRTICLVRYQIARNNKVQGKQQRENKQMQKR